MDMFGCHGFLQRTSILTADILQEHSRPNAIVAAIPYEQTSSSLSSRRQAMQMAMLALLAQQTAPAWASERRGVTRYIKKKTLDPLET